MNNNHVNNEIYDWFFRFKNIFINLYKKKLYRYIAIAVVIIACILWLSDDFTNRFTSILLVILLVLFLSDYFISLYFFKKLKKIELMLPNGEVPLLKYITKNQQRVIMHFHNPGIPEKVWQDKKDKIETSLRMKIGNIKSNKGEIILEGCWNHDYFEDLYWSDDYLQKGARIVLGDNLGVKEIWSMDLFPHVLIAGSTGCGKSYLFKIIMLQFIKKKYDLHIVDFKGGVDFGRKWEEKCDVVSDKEKTLVLLERINEELERRKKIFKESEADTIAKYNKGNANKLNRIVIAIDEAAELLDTSGLEKEEKDLTLKIRRNLVTILRLGRALGIHVVIATQRPDAKILTGDIKNNITYRICGKAEDTLSLIALDNTKASELPDGLPGIFINHFGTVFKGYLFDDKDLE